jgi:hypothetical protein
MVFAWSMQFIVMNGKCTASPKILSLGIIGLMEVIPAVSMALFAGHIVDQKKRKLISQMHFGFFSNQFWSIFIDMAGRAGLLLQTILYSIYFSFSWGFGLS